MLAFSRSGLPPLPVSDDGKGVRRVAHCQVAMKSLQPNDVARDGGIIKKAPSMEEGAMGITIAATSDKHGVYTK